MRRMLMQGLLASRLPKLPTSITSWSRRQQWKSLWAACKSGLAPKRSRAACWAAMDIRTHEIAAVVVAPPAKDGKPRILKAAVLTRDAAPKDAVNGITEIIQGQTLPGAAQLGAIAQSVGGHAQRWTLLLPRDEYRISVMAEPAVPATELAQSVRWQLAPTLDFPVEDASVDFLKMPTEAWQPGRAPELYAIAARGEAVRQRAALFDQARLQLAAIDIRETAQRNIAALAERHTDSNAGTTADSDELLVMLVFMPDEVRITFNWHQEMYMDRLIAESVDLSHSPDRRTAISERIALQVERSIEAVRGSFPFMQAARVLVAGAPEGFCELLAASTGDPVSALDAEQLFDLSQVPALCEPAEFIRHLHAIGAALRGMESAG